MRPRWRSVGRRRPTPHPFRGLTAKENFLAARGMTVLPSGEESLTRPLRQVGRGAAGLRPDQAIEEAVLERSRYGVSNGDRGNPETPTGRHDRHDHRLRLPSRSGSSVAPVPAGLPPTTPATGIWSFPDHSARNPCAPSSRNARPHADPCMAVRYPPFGDGDGKTRMIGQLTLSCSARKSSNARTREGSGPPWPT